MGADETVVKVKCKKTVVGLVSRLGISAIVTDDLSTYKPVVEELRLEHQVCVAHVKKNVYNRLEGIDGWDRYKAMIWCLVRELPVDGGKKLLRMERRVRSEPSLRRLVVDLCGKWQSLLWPQRVKGML